MRGLARWCAALMIAAAGMLAAGVFAQAPAPELPKGLFPPALPGQAPTNGATPTQAPAPVPAPRAPGAQAPSPADVAMPTLPDGRLAVPPLARVTDTAGVLGGGAKDRLEAKLAAFEQAKGSQLAVLLVPTIGTETIEEFATRVTGEGKLGRAGVEDVYEDFIIRSSFWRKLFGVY